MSDERAVPVFLTLEEVLEIHQDQLARYGGSDGILNSGSLESAIAQPQATFGGHFLHGDVFEMAAVYLYHIAQNHAFADGNKRVATVTAIVFLAMNGFELAVPDDDLEHLVMSVARGEARPDDVAAFFREHCITA